MEPLGTFDTLGPKNGVDIHVRVYKVALSFIPFFLLKLSEISIEQLLHSKCSHRLL